MSKFLIVVLSVILFPTKFLSSQVTNEKTTSHPILLRTCVFKTCECVSVANVIMQVMCDQQNNVDEWKQSRNNNFISEYANYTYNITIKFMNFIPSNFIQNLDILSITFEDLHTSFLENDAFKEPESLKTLKIKKSSLKSLPDLQHLKDSLQYLSFENSYVKSISYELQNLYKLSELILQNNDVKFVNEKAFEGLQNLEILDLSQNTLIQLPPNIFDDLKMLKSLNLSHNQLLTADGIFSITKPKFVFLNYNNLTRVNDIFKERIEETEVLHLDHNPLTNIIGILFVDYIPNVQNLDLSHCYISELNFSCFQNLTHLHQLDLSWNFLENISNEKINFGSNLKLDLSNNNISSFKAELTYTVERLNLSGNQIEKLSSFLQLKQLVEIEICRNKLEAILISDLKGTHGTHSLNFCENKIVSVEPRSFFPLRNDLRILNLRKNRIKNLNYCVNYLSTLQILDISYNDIQFSLPYEFTGLNELKELHMEYNKIITLGKQLQNLPKLLHLEIKYNNIDMISSRQLPKSLKSLVYTGNPIKCNCQFMIFLKWLDELGSIKVDADDCLYNNSSNRNFKNLAISACPNLCKCTCDQNDKEAFVSVDCSEKNITNSLALFQKMDNMDLTEKYSIIVGQNDNPRFFVSDKVVAVNLENNNIFSLENWTFPIDLKILRLANNRLTSLPVSVTSLSYLKTISLSNNSWSCNCDDISFKKWMRSKISDITDINNTRCGSRDNVNALKRKLLVELDDVDMCPVSTKLYVTLTFCILILLLVTAALKIGYSRYELYIKVWLYAHGVTWIKEKELDKDKPFDAFISFSNDDEQLVINEIIPEIESRMPNIRLCLHYLHFLLGEYIQDNIMNAVRSSKRTVLILTKNYLESEWCLMEFRAAHNQALEDKINRIIIIKAGEMPNEIDPLIKTYLETTTYVTWGENYFWEKFLYALPVPSKHSRSYSCTSSTTLI